MKKTPTHIRLARITPFAIMAVFPVLTLAVSNLCDLISTVVYYFNVAIYMIIAFATVIFVYNVVRYFFKADVENKKEAGLYVMYSVIGFFVILSFWGLVNIVTNTFKLQTNAPASFIPSGGTGVGSAGCNSAANNAAAAAVIGNSASTVTGGTPYTGSSYFYQATGNSGGGVVFPNGSTQ